MSEPSSVVVLVQDPYLRRAMEDGVLVSEAYEHGLRRAADVLSDLLRREDAPTKGSDAGGRLAVLACGDVIGRKLARLLQSVAELRAQGVELAGVVGLLVRISDGEVDSSEMYAELRSIAEGFHQPYTIVGADGVRRGAAEGDPRIAQLPRLSLALDDVREVVWRDGQEIPLRRRMVLRRLLLLFALSPGAVFSKEDVVQAVWGVKEYHPLRNDPALFTNIMRARKMLGDARGDVLRVVDGGYRFVVPSDFCCLIRTEHLPRRICDRQ